MDGRVAGAYVEREGERLEIGTRRGVVLACGGFPASDDLKLIFYSWRRFALRKLLILFV